MMTTAARANRSMVVGLFVVLGALGVLGTFGAPASAVERGGPLTAPTSLRPAKLVELDLCRGVSLVNHLVVGRNHPPNPETFTFPSLTIGTSRGAVRALAKALCALPPVPPGMQACPVDLGVRYTLWFSEVPTAKFVARPVIVSPMGCQTIFGLGATRWTSGRPGFWSTFGAAIGLRHATNATFAGALTNSSSS
jgi:hypothetical protein